MAIFTGHIGVIIGVCVGVGLLVIVLIVVAICARLICKSRENKSCGRYKKVILLHSFYAIFYVSLLLYPSLTVIKFSKFLVNRNKLSTNFVIYHELMSTASDLSLTV